MISSVSTSWLPPDHAEIKTVSNECISVGCLGYQMTPQLRYITPSYRCIMDYYKNMLNEEYKMNDWLINVNNLTSKLTPRDKHGQVSSIFDLPEIKVPRPLWLNKNNLDETLHTIKWIITFS